MIIHTYIAFYSMVWHDIYCDDHIPGRTTICRKPCDYCKMSCKKLDMCGSCVKYKGHDKLNQIPMEYETISHVWRMLPKVLKHQGHVVGIWLGAKICRYMWTALLLRSQWDFSFQIPVKSFPGFLTFSKQLLLLCGMEW